MLFNINFFFEKKQFLIYKVFNSFRAFANRLERRCNRPFERIWTWHNPWWDFEGAHGVCGETEARLFPRFSVSSEALNGWWNLKLFRFKLEDLRRAAAAVCDQHRHRNGVLCRNFLRSIGAAIHGHGPHTNDDGLRHQPVPRLLPVARLRQHQRPLQKQVRTKAADDCFPVHRSGNRLVPSIRCL